MQLGMLGVGRMGGNIVRRLSRQGHQCVVFDQNLVAIKALVGKGVTGDRNGRDPRVERGDMHCDPSGAGRFVKMLHNGIAYGLMQAYAEGFNILRGAASEELHEEKRYQLDLPDTAELWRRDSVIGSWLLDLTAMALAEDPKLSPYSSIVEDSSEGRRTINAAIAEAVPADVLSAALYARFRSREQENFSDKLLSATRNKFGGQVEPKAGR
jgi:6-phosphogluconate dehydrogenase